jgi:hypothetical protein
MSPNDYEDKYFNELEEKIEITKVKQVTQAMAR